MRSSIKSPAHDPPPPKIRSALRPPDSEDGNGHDAFAGVSYELLNRIRISDVKVEQNQLTLRGDATAAYGPELGLKKFVREFVYRTNVGFTVTDEVETAKPAIFTWLMHADDRIVKEEGCLFRIEAGRVKLIIDPTLYPAVEDVQQSIESKIETNNLTAPGPPGAVDKGERQARGQKLLLATTVPTTSLRFVQQLKIEGP